MHLAIVSRAVLDSQPATVALSQKLGPYGPVIMIEPFEAIIAQLEGFENDSEEYRLEGRRAFTEATTHSDCLEQSLERVRHLCLSQDEWDHRPTRTLIERCLDPWFEEIGIVDLSIWMWKPNGQTWH
ncbi:MAG: hypothetical protein WD467_00625 [Candidatus Saccharimonadales bacterium]